MKTVPEDINLNNIVRDVSYDVLHTYQEHYQKIYNKFTDNCPYEESTVTKSEDVDFKMLNEI